MNRFVRSFAHVVIATLAAVAAAQAEATQLVISGSANFPTSFTAFTDSVSTAYLYFDNSGVASAPMTPFNASLGTLDKVNVDWDFGGSFNGTTGSSGGGAGIGFGGSMYVNSISYAGNGGGNGIDGIAPSTLFSFTVSNVATHNEFLSSEAGVSYSSAIWAAFTGVSPYTVSLDSGTGSYGSYDGVASGTMTTYRNVIVSYTYTPSAVPEIEPATGSSDLSLVAGVLAMIEQRRRRATLAT